MAWTLTDDLDAFLDAAGGFLSADAAENTVLLTVAEAVRREGQRAFGEQPPHYGWWCPPGRTAVTGAYLQTPPFSPALGRMPESAAAELATALAERGDPLTGVFGGTAEARAFAAAWRSATGADHSVRRRERLYRLGTLTVPEPPGAARPARPEDRDLVIGWFEAFARGEGEPVRDFSRGVDRRIAEGRMHLWEDEGQPVSMAGASPASAGMVRIGPVYTPPERRRRGYAAGATAAASAHAAARGAREVLLFTDLANPTSNALYQRLGYRPVSDRLVLAFSPSAGD